MKSWVTTTLRTSSAFAANVIGQLLRHTHKVLGYAYRITRVTIKYCVKASRPLIKSIAKYLHRGYRVSHKHIAKRPHEKLMSKEGRYAQWHLWEHHQKVHYSVLTVYTLLVLVILGTNIHRVMAAPDLFHTWNFSNVADYNFDNSKLENDGSSIRLKAQNYANDANTSALYHMDESG